MREVYLLRHGAAEGSSPGGDAARRLTKAGRDALERAAAVIARWGVRADQLWVSPYVRAEETARIVGPAFGSPPSTAREDLVPEGPTGAVAEALWTSRSRVLVVVSHMPLLPSVAGLLTGARVEMGTGTLVHLALIGAEGPRGAAALLGIFPAERLAPSQG